MISVGCGSSSRASSDQDPLADTEHRLNQLEQRINSLANNLSAHGRGAYANGPALMVDQQGAHSLLQRLHDLQLELQTTRERIGEHRATLGETRQRLVRMQEEKADLEGQIFRLKRFEGSVIIAREELASHKDRIVQLNQELVVAQRQRLDSERAYADFSRALLELEPLHTQQLLDLQQSVRENVDRVWPEDAPGHPHEMGNFHNRPFATASLTSSTLSDDIGSGHSDTSDPYRRDQAGHTLPQEHNDDHQSPATSTMGPTQ